jgi:hypothetical protein
MNYVAPFSFFIFDRTNALSRFRKNLDNACNGITGVNGFATFDQALSLAAIRNNHARCRFERIAIKHAPFLFDAWCKDAPLTERATCFSPWPMLTIQPAWRPSFYLINAIGIGMRSQPHCPHRATQVLKFMPLPLGVTVQQRRRSTSCFAALSDET